VTRAVLAVLAVLALSAPRPARGEDARPTSWATVQKLVAQSELIAVVTVRSIDLDEHTMILDVKKVLFVDRKAPRKITLTYYAGDDLHNRVPVGSRALAFLVSARKRWMPTYADGFGIWSIQDGEVIEWLEGKRDGTFYTVDEVSQRIARWARKRSER
jgi:hypothetical protein